MASSEIKSQYWLCGKCRKWTKANARFCATKECGRTVEGAEKWARRRNRLEA